MERRHATTATGQTTPAGCRARRPPRQRAGGAATALEACLRTRAAAARTGAAPASAQREVAADVADLDRPHGCIEAQVNAAAAAETGVPLGTAALATDGPEPACLAQPRIVHRAPALRRRAAAPASRPGVDRGPRPPRTGSRRKSRPQRRTAREALRRQPTKPLPHTSETDRQPEVGRLGARDHGRRRTATRRPASRPRATTATCARSPERLRPGRAPPSRPPGPAGIPARRATRPVPKFAWFRTISRTSAPRREQSREVLLMLIEEPGRPSRQASVRVDHR